MDNCIVVNLFGGPGSGKSTISASLFSELKWEGVDCELVTEFAKDKVWEEATKVLDNQLYIFARQEQRINRLYGKVKVILTDSSIPLTLAYVNKKQNTNTFRKIVIESFNHYNNINFFIKRNDVYVQNGRTHTYNQAKEKDVLIKSILDDNNIEYETIDFNREAVVYIIEKIFENI